MTVVKQVTIYKYEVFSEPGFSMCHDEKIGKENQKEKAFYLRIDMKNYREKSKIVQF